MRYLLSELATLAIDAKFTTLDTVTVIIYDKSDMSAVPLDSAACTEAGVTGRFSWNFSNLTTQPTVFTQYRWVMSNGASEVEGEIDAGGWVEDVEPLGSADTCKISVNLYDADGNPTLPSDLYDQAQDNYIELKTAFYGSSRYYRIGKYKPSFDSLTGSAFWVMPQGATVRVLVDSFGIDESSIVVPSTTTADLYTWINA